MVKRALTVAGSDTSGGAGIQADLKVFEEHGIFGTTALTSIVTYDPANELHHDIDFVDSAVIEKQLTSAFALHAFDGVKSGMLGSTETVTLLAAALHRAEGVRYVLDPVLVCKGQGMMVDLKQAFLDELLPQASVVTPNLQEAAALVGAESIDTVNEMRDVARELHSRGAKAVMVKGGARLAGNQAVDVLYDGEEFTVFTSPKLGDLMVNGAGCSLAAAITSELALGSDVRTAVERAKAFVTHAIAGHISNASSVDSVYHAAARLSPSEDVNVQRQ
ncbi:bifunctional hydroxymethylpyrimidine kinase/phosphomethylpyrimidine kinase [Saxibacter everestensis]|uniref:pyridoxal kinase n=1 Tax=Saxibacter everestensis TaxID=2909229 RepID=A0ABY8QXS2_9MICO|nr:bifunctional hydroxymethylpyrimidine kinase/phosphomethylpyrimidine kinase [Brevibacteriaceae bacterium ZFBP1038]